MGRGDFYFSQHYFDDEVVKDVHLRLPAKLYHYVKAVSLSKTISMNKLIINMVEYFHEEDSAFQEMREVLAAHQAS